VSGLWNDFTGLSFGKVLCLDLDDHQRMSSNCYESNWQWQQMLNGRYITMGFNKESMIFGHVNTVIEK
jgi:hypothetical protein